MIVNFKTAALLIATTALIAACAHPPTGPSVMVLPGGGKTYEEFHADDTACRQSATQALQTTKGGEVSAQRRFDMAYIQCMYAKGHQVPIPGGPPSYSRPSGAGTPANVPPPPPAGTPPPPPPGPSR